MSLPIPARADVTIEVDSRCYCCFRMPRSKQPVTPPSTPESGDIAPKLSERISSVFYRSSKSDNVEGNRPRLYSMDKTE